MNVLLDTHVWLWWLTASGDLPAHVRDALDERASHGTLRLSAISLWEAQMLHARKRLTLPLPFGEWLSRSTDERVLQVAPLDVPAVRALDSLPTSFHGDPADRLIVATGRAHGWTLATHDVRIRRSRLVKLWKP